MKKNSSRLNLSRRQVLKITGAGALTLYLEPLFALGGCAFRRSAVFPALSLADISPIQRDLPDIAPQMFFGNRPEWAHNLLADDEALAAARARLPAPNEHVPLAVVGGGIAGLTTAYLLRAHSPRLLEQSARYGGMSQGQSWRGLDYAIGAAYFIEPEADDNIGRLMQELGIDKLWTIEAGEKLFELQNSLRNDLWSGESAPEAKPLFRRLAAYFRTVNEGQKIPFPDIPIVDPAQADYVKGLDRFTFKAHLEKIAGDQLHPQIETALEHYCWSSMGASFREVSAAAGLNFYAAEFGNVAVLPAGNAAVAERLMERIISALGADSLRAETLVFDVRPVSDGVIIGYQDRSGAIHSLHARAAALCCPKFIAGKLIRDLPLERRHAIGKLTYRSYLVANVLLNASLEKVFYDLYLLGDGKNGARFIEEGVEKQNATDVVLANFAQPAPGRTVLTLYRACPYGGADLPLLDDRTYRRARIAFERQITQSILPLLSLKERDVVDLRLARWGHSVPVAARGLIADGTVETLRRPLGDSIFFINQDNWALPAFETSVKEALIWAPEISKAIT